MDGSGNMLQHPRPATTLAELSDTQVSTSGELMLPTLTQLLPVDPCLNWMSSIYFCVSEHYRAVRINGVPVGSAGQVMNLSPPPEPSDMEVFYHPAQWGQDRVGWGSSADWCWLGSRQTGPPVSLSDQH
ncbi:hypothetical protein PAMP_002140 [Pampus punctatissimus]